MDELTKKAYYIYSIILLINFDYEKYYRELFKNALKYGMTKNQFWYEDYKDYFIYEEAYQERLHEQTHIQGYYNCIAYNVVLANAFSSIKSNNKTLNYPEIDIYSQYKKKSNKNENTSVIDNVKITKENLNQVFIQRLSNCY